MIGSDYRKMPDFEYKRVGRNCVTLGWIGVAVWVAIVGLNIILIYIF
jgi:hypothetical protein